MLIINFEGREVKGLSKGRYDETFAGEDASSSSWNVTGEYPTLYKNCPRTVSRGELVTWKSY